MVIYSREELIGLHANKGLVEHFGGKLGVLGYPMHGKPSVISRAISVSKENHYLKATDVLEGLPMEFQVARYITFLSCCIV